MVSRLSSKAEAISTRLAPWAARAGVALLAVSLTGAPGVTAAPAGLTLFASGLTMAVAAGLLWARGVRPVPWTSLLCLCLFFWSALGSSHSPSPYLSSLALASLAGFVAIAIIFELAAATVEGWKETARSLCALALCSAVYGLYQWKSLPGQALQANFTNPDCYSLVLAIGFFLILSLALEMRGLRQALAVGAAVLVFLAILLTGSRAGLLATGLGYAGVTATLLASRSGRMRKSALGLLFLPSIFFLILLGSGTQTRTLERFERLGRGNDPVAIKSRWDVVRYGLKSVIQRPLWGHGIGCFHLAYQQVRPALLTGEVYMNVAHNDYMQWLVETGIPGLLLWIALLALSLARCWRSYRSPTPWVAGQIGSLLAIGAYTSLNFACPVPADLLWIGAIFGLSAALPGLKTAPAVAPWAPRAFPIVAVIAGIALWTVRLGWTTIREVEAEKRAAKAEATLDWESAVAEIRPALERQPQNQRLQLRLAELAKRAFVLTGAPVWLDTQEKALREAYQASPQDPRTLLSLISFFQEQLRPDLAEPYLEQAQAQAPYSVEVRRAAARSLILQGKFSQATTSLSDLERTGVSVDDSALADLIFLLENKARGQGTLVLSKVAATDPDRCADLALAAAATAQHRKNYEVALALLKQARYLATNRPDVAWEIANTRNLAGESQLEFSYLDKLRRDRVVELDDQIMQKVWKRWAELAVQHGQLDLVIAQLEDYLIVHRNENWARIALSEVYLKRGLKAEARSALRSGLSFDRDGALRVRLGDLCASQGLPELARGYYREALPLSSMPKEIESKLKQLKLSQDNLDELEP